MIILSPGEVKEVNVTLTALPSGIQGTVSSSLGGVLQGALVEIVETGQSTTTDSSGVFSLTNLPPETPLTVRVSAAGYETVEL